MNKYTLGQADDTGQLSEDLVVFWLCTDRCGWALAYVQTDVDGPWLMYRQMWMGPGLKQAARVALSGSPAAHTVHRMVLQYSEPDHRSCVNSTVACVSTRQAHGKYGTSM